MILDNHRLQTIKASELKEGDMIDLEGDKFADPNNDNAALECEYCIVEGIEQETPECIVIYTQHVNVAVPTDHPIKLFARERVAPQ